MKFRIAVFAAMLISLMSPIKPVLADNSTSPAVLITEIKLGDPAVATAEMPKEYVALYNQSDVPVDLTGWKLQYAKSTFSNQHCNDSDWSQFSVNGSASTTVLSGTLQPGQVSSPIVRQLTDNTSGSLHVIDAAGGLQDLAGWGSGSPCYSGGPAAIPPNAKSLQRLLDCVSAYPVNTSNNAADFAVNSPSPNSLGALSTGCPDQTPPPPPPTTTCEGVTISEILPNPAGTDSGHEFIELNNPTDQPISLSGCGLQVGGSATVYRFSDVTLGPGQFEGFYDSDTGLTLPNAAGGTVYLLSPSLEELNSVNYQPNLDDDVSWANFDSGWQATYAPTPNAANQLLADKPCPGGQERSDDTGRCRDMVVASVTSGCPIGQIKNPDTNRCRLITTTPTSTLTSCRAGQERNPDTNRCRNIAATSSTSPKPCPTGQTRNSDTNRCRKVVVAGASNLAKVKDIPSAIAASHISWYLAGLAGAGALGYGLWEWRLDLANLIRKFKNRAGRS